MSAAEGERNDGRRKLGDGLLKMLLPLNISRCINADELRARPFKTNLSVRPSDTLPFKLSVYLLV